METRLCPAAVRSFQVEAGKGLVRLVFDTDDVGMSFRFVSGEVINITCGALDDVRDVEAGAASSDSPPVEASEEEDGLTASNGCLEVYISRDPYYYEIRSSGRALLKEAIDDKDIVGDRYTDALTFVQQDGRIRSVIDSFALEHEEKLYGFGEKFSPINKRGLNMEAWNCDARGVGSDRAYKNIPFFMNSKNYGVLINTTSRINYSLGTRSFDAYSIAVEDSRLDFYFIAGGSFKEILSRYMDLTGRMEVLPPKWSFGLWMSRYGYTSREQVEATGAALRERNIPADVLGIDPFWLENGHYCDFVFNERKFPNPRQMFTALRERGFKTRVWIQPTVSVKTEMFKEGDREGFFLKDGAGQTYLWQCPLPNQPEDVEDVDFSKIDIEALGVQPQAGIVDFTNPEAIDWFLSKLAFLIEWGAGVIMCDFGEDIPEDTHFFNGKTGKEMHNVYSSLYASLVYDFMKERRSEPPICLIRSGWTGLHRYPICWAGDPQVTWEAMREVLRGGLSLALTGVAFWSHDIGGTAPVVPDARLYVRWMQFGMFTSHTRCHGTYPKEPWHFGALAEETFRKFDRLRYSLIPYIYSCAWECMEMDLPFIKPLVLEYQDDPIAQEIDDEYIFGNSFLVAPVFSAEDSRHLYLPEGKWIDYWTKEPYAGGRVYRYAAPLAVLPLFVKSGAIIPMQEEVQYIEDKPLEKLLLDIYPDGRSAFTYRDDYTSCEIRTAVDGDTVSVDLGSTAMEYTLVLHGCSGMQVEVNGSMVPPDRMTTDGESAIIEMAS